MPTPEAVKLMHKLRTYGKRAEFALNDKEAAEEIDRFVAARGQTGAGDAGERARALKVLKKAGVAITTTVFIDALSAALRDSRRDGAEAMRRDAAQSAVEWLGGAYPCGCSRGIADHIEALPIPEKTDAG